MPTSQIICRALVGISLLLAPLIASAAITNYTTGFESAAGYTNGLALANQQGWIGYVVASNLTYTNAGSSGNSVISPGLGGSGQAAYVGLTPLPAGYDTYVELLQFFNLDPIGFAQPAVNFSTRVKVIDSTYADYDYFRWDFADTNGVYLFGIEFDNYAQEINHLDSTNRVSRIGSYTNGIEYALGVAMNFASNRCSITWNGATLTNNLPIAIKGPGLGMTFGSFAAVWQPSDPAFPGNNYMIFDDIRLISSPLVPLPPQLRVLTPGGSGAATLRLTGQDGFRFAVDGSTNLITWLAVITNVVSGGTADYTDSAATGKGARYYRARWVP